MTQVDSLFFVYFMSRQKFTYTDTSLTIPFSCVSAIECFRLSNNRRSLSTVLASITRAHASRALGDESSKMEACTRRELVLPEAVKET